MVNAEIDRIVQGDRFDLGRNFKIQPDKHEEVDDHRQDKVDKNKLAVEEKVGF